VHSSPRAVGEISCSSHLAEQGRLIFCPYRPLEKSSVESLTVGHTCRPWTSFRLGWTFFSIRVCLHSQSRIASGIALAANRTLPEVHARLAATGSIWLGLCAGLALSVHSQTAIAACSPGGPAIVSGTTVTCSSPGAQGSRIGNGPNGAPGNGDDVTVNVNDGATISVTNDNAISLHDGAMITVGSPSGTTTTTVMTTTNGGANQGQYGTGDDTIELNKNSTLIIYSNGEVITSGTQNNSEAINAESSGNTITNYGLIKNGSGSAIFFENTGTSGSDPRNKVDNFGTIDASSPTGNGEAIGSFHDVGIDIINETGGKILGNLDLQGGNDNVTLDPGSVITGHMDGGAGTNVLTLNASAVSSDTIPGAISDFQTLDKTGAGTWTLTGPVGNNGGATPLAVEVIGGTLVLTGNNTAFNGSVTIDSGATLEARAQSLPPTINDLSGDVLINQVSPGGGQPNDGTYAGQIVGSGIVTKIGVGTLTMTGSNTYSGGTVFDEGAIAASADSAFGAATGPLTFNGGELKLDSSFNLSSTRMITLNGPNGGFAGGGTIDANSFQTTIAQGITGAGGLTVTDSSGGGAGKVILTGSNSYGGGTTIAAGTLQLGNGGTTGSIVGNVVDNGALAFDRSDTVTFPGLISGAGSVNQIGTGTTILTADNSYTGGTTIAAGTLQLGNGGTTGSIIGNVTDNGTLAFDHSNRLTFAGVISGSGAVSQIGSGTTVLTADSPYTGGTNVSAGTLVVGDFVHPSAALSGGGPIVVGSGGTLGGYGSVTGPTVNNGVIAAGSATPGIIGPATGTFTIIGNLLNHGVIQLASGNSIGNVLEVRGSYVGAGGSMAINTFLGGDGSPSDRLVINGDPVATGNTSVHVTNVGGPGALTTANGILVVDAINGATTAPGAFSLSNPELRAGAFNYRLFQGGVSGSADDWFLRSSFMAPGLPLTPVVPPGPPILPPGPPIFPSAPPPDTLPPGVAFPIIGPELATYGVVQPLARQLGLSILGTLDDRVGDTYQPDGCAVAPPAPPNALPKPRPALAPCPLFSPTIWGRFFGQTLDNRYSAFADPRASGNLGGFQGGIDLLHGSLIAGHSERAGLYGAYGNVNSDVTGLVTNPAATAYVLSRTGSMSLNAWSAGGYWTHVGPGGWYLDGVLQGTWYYGSASTQFANLNTDGTGFIASLEGGYPFSWPQLGPGFVIEPQGQILWQKVSFRHDYDGLGDVALGDTTGPSGRIGLKTEWTIVTAGGQVWQPYLRGNLWRDWGAEADAVYSGTNIVPLLSQATMLELGGGLTGRINANVSVFANVDYEFAVGSGDDKRNGVRGAFGAKYTW